MAEGYSNKEYDYQELNNIISNSVYNSSSADASEANKYNPDDIEEVDFENISTEIHLSSNSVYNNSMYYGPKEETSSGDEMVDLIGNMTQDEYNQYISELKDNYDTTIEQYEGQLDEIEKLLKELNLTDSDIVRWEDIYVRGNAITSLNQQIELWLTHHEDELSEEAIDFIDKTESNEEIYKYLIDHYSECKDIYDEVMSHKEEDNKYVKEVFGYLGINNIDEYAAYKDKLYLLKDNIEEAIKTTKNMKDSAYYDNLKYLKAYQDFGIGVSVQDGNDIINMVDQFGFYDFEEYHKNHPNVSPLEYYEYLTTHVSNFNPSNIRGIDNFGDLETIIKAKNTAPDLYKTYAYLYSNDKDKFESMFDDMRYEINNLEGQLRANDFLSHLGVADGDNDILEAAANELGITTEGLKDGLISFGEGLYYSVEALGTALGICKENRAMSAEEYKRMYILYALLSEEEKIGLGVLTKDENGNVTNANENSIIDYTKEYSGGGLLSGTYQVTQGIGNMLPSMAVSAAITYVCPVAGAATIGSIASSTLMGISAGGNAYHSAMVDGSSVFGAIMYGIATGASESISERILGGLPFLSDAKVTSWATYLQAMAKEGTQEMFQGVMDIVYQSALLGKDLPDDPAVFEDLLKQGFYGAVTAGIMQAPALATSRYGACLFKKLMKDNNVSVKEQQAAIQAMRETDTHGILTDLSDDEIKLKYGEGILNYAEAIRIQNQSNVDIQTAMLMYQNNVSEEVATIMKKSNVSVEIAKQMNEYGVTAVAADIMLKYNNNMDPEVATIMADNNIENYDVAYNMFKYEVNQNTAEIMNEHHCSKEIAVTMDKYKVGYDVATKIVTEGITDEATIDILSKHKYATDAEIAIINENGVDYDTAHIMNKYEVNQNTAEIMQKYRCSKDVAVIMDKENVNYDVATIMFSEGVTKEIATIMHTEGINSTAATVMNAYSLDSAQATQFATNMANLGLKTPEEYIAHLEKKTSFKTGADISMMLEVSEIMDNNGIISLTKGGGIEKSAYEKVYSKLKSYDAKKAFYTEMVVANTFQWSAGVNEYIASIMYQDETGKSFWELSKNDRQKYIKDNQSKIDGLSADDKEYYTTQLSQDREAVASGTIKRLEWLESQGFLKPGMDAETVLGMIMSNVPQEDYLSAAYVQAYKAKWGTPDKNGNVQVVCFQSADAGADNAAAFGGSVGRAEGAFVMSKEFYDSLLSDRTLFDDSGKCINTAKLREKLGGVAIGESPVAIVQTVNIDDIKMPSGHLEGAYVGDWTPGGFTSAGEYIAHPDGTITLQGGVVEGFVSQANIFNADGTLNENISLELLSDTQKAEFIKGAADSMLNGKYGALNGYLSNPGDPAKISALHKAFAACEKHGVDISEGITERYKSGELSAKDVIGLVNSFNLSDKSVQQLFNKLVGSKLASWLPNATSAKEVYINLLTACDEAGIDAKTLSKNIEIMKAMEDYYLDAMGGLNLDTGESVFETYRTHGITHVFDVLTESINAVKAMKDSGVKGIDLDTVMLSAIMHDTGMSGGQQLSLSVKDGKLLIETQSTQADAGTYRESHSFNSGVSIIENAYSLRSYGYSDAQIAEAALLAFAHSKSNSGLNPLAGNDAGWSFAIQALQKAADASGCDFDIAKALYDAGILSSTETKLSDNPITVKCPKGYETENGHIKTDENGKPIKDGSGGKVTGKVETYTFSDGVIDRLSYEALAVRIGDALTNNDHAIVNQYFGKISFDTTNYSNQYSTQQIINQMIKNGQIESANANSIVNTLLKTDDGLMFAAFAETQHSTPETSVTFEIEGKTKNDSQPFVLGENNQTYRVEASDNGVDVVVSVKDTEAVPYCTLFAIQERAGELTSKGVDIFTAASDGSELSLVIEIDKNASTNTKNLYQQYAKYYARDKRIKVKIVEK